MNCCDTYGNCNQGRDCPVRRAAATQLLVTMENPEPFTFDYVMGWIINLFAAIGAVAFAGLLGLYFSGFFHWLFERASAGG